MAFLLTWHGTLLCRHRESGALVHRPMSPAAGDADPVALDLPIELLQPGFSDHLRATLPELPVNLPGALQRSACGGPVTSGPSPCSTMAPSCPPSRMVTG